MLSPSPFFETARGKKRYYQLIPLTLYKYSSFSVVWFGLNLESGPHM